MRVLRKPTRSPSSRIDARRRVLVVGGDTQVGLWVVRSLGRGGLEVFCTCRNQVGLAAHSRYCRGAWVLPGPVGDGTFVDQLLELARGLGVGSIMTIAENYHLALIRARNRFEPEIKIFSPPADAFQRATDKDYMQRLCGELGVPVARGTTLDRLLSGQVGELRYPLVLRTRQQNEASAGGGAPWKAAYARTPEQLQRLHDQVRDIAGNVLVQEYHPGVEDHVQILMHRGEPFMVGDYIGEAHMPLAGGVTVMRVSCRHERLIEDAVRLLRALEWEGIAGVQFHYDPATGRYIFLEINPRFIGGLPTVILAGFDAPFLLWQSHFEPERMKPGRYQLGLRTRIVGGHANWMLGMFRRDPLPPGQNYVSRLAALARFLWHCGPWTLDDTFWLGDMRPALADWRLMLNRLGARTVDIIGNPAEAEGTP